MHFNAPPAFPIVAIVAVWCLVSESINGVAVETARLWSVALIITHARRVGFFQCIERERETMGLFVVVPFVCRSLC